MIEILVKSFGWEEQRGRCFWNMERSMGRKIPLLLLSKRTIEFHEIKKRDGSYLWGFLMLALPCQVTSGSSHSLLPIPTYTHTLL